MSNEDQAKALAEANQINLNLQSALNELEQQLKWTSNRCATMAMERDNGLRRVKGLEEQIKTREEQFRLALEQQQQAPVAELVPVGETKKLRKSAEVN